MSNDLTIIFKYFLSFYLGFDIALSRKILYRALGILWKCLGNAGKNFSDIIIFFKKFLKKFLKTLDKSI